jgi:hypothetical protein
MQYSSTIQTIDNKFKGIVVSNVTNKIIYETYLHENKSDALRAVNNFILHNSRQITQVNNNEVPSPVTKQPAQPVVVKKCCSRR